MKVKKGDTVKVIAGDAKGKIGKVLQVLAKKNRIIVEGKHRIRHEPSMHIRKAESSRRKPRFTFRM